MTRYLSSSHQAGKENTCHLVLKDEPDQREPSSILANTNREIGTGNLLTNQELRRPK
ncbi:unnamed protein product [Periconia digitata]|uniref:Uncharacterized protein n=1 Tax=Periconia digitata TaxID=1303443 RepID=A0A9W4XRH8_9PLEO|nr:unnamed protein product [Periconia digitata]